MEYVNVSDDKTLMKNVLSWRLINRSSKSVVDQLLRARSTPQMHYERMTERKLDKGIWLATKTNLDSLIYTMDKKNNFWAPWQVTNLIGHFQGNEEGNPFLTQSVKIRLCHQMHASPCWQSLLARFGHHISALTLKFDLNNIDLATVCRHLKLLQYVPNLKILKLAEWWHDVFDEDGIEYRDDRIRSVHLPPLNQLEVLDWSQFRNSDPHVKLGLKFFESYGGQLRILICSMDFLGGCDVATLNSLLPNICCYHAGEIDNIRDQRNLSTLAQLDWALKEFQVSEITVCSEVKLTEFFTSINKFAPTLIKLQLLAKLPDDDFNFNNLDDVDSASRERAMIILPNLIKLSSIVFNINQRWFRRVVPVKFPNLEELHLNTAEEKADMDKLAAMFADMPNLKNIFVSHFYPGNGGPVEMRTLKR